MRRWSLDLDCAGVLRWGAGTAGRERSREMPRYLVSFDEGAMTFPDEDLPDVAEAAHAVVREAMNAGVWVFGGGLYQQVSVVDTDGTVTDRPYPESKAYLGGFSVV